MGWEKLKGYLNRIRKCFNSQSLQNGGCHWIDGKSASSARTIITSSCGCQTARQPVAEINRDGADLTSVTVTIARGCRGFGFSVIGDSPVRVGTVDLGSPAEKGGLRPGDQIILVNQLNVSKSTVNGVARLIKQTGEVHLHVRRGPRPTVPGRSLWNLQNTPTRAAGLMAKRQDPLGSPESGFESVSDLHHADAREMRKGDGEKQVETAHRLLSVEVDFISFMQRGLQRYCCPPCPPAPRHHKALTHTQRRVLFQNMSELVSLSQSCVHKIRCSLHWGYSKSQYHHEDNDNDDDDDDAEDDDDDDSLWGDDDAQFMTDVILGYHSKIRALCQAHVTYASGLGAANQMLIELRKKNARFARFVQQPPLAAGQPSISAFLFRPLQHIKELCLLFEDLVFGTPSSAACYHPLTTLTRVLQDSVAIINTFSSARVQSMTSGSFYVSSGGRSDGSGCCNSTCPLSSSRASYTTNSSKNGDSSSSSTSSSSRCGSSSSNNCSSSSNMSSNTTSSNTTTSDNISTSNTTSNTTSDTISNNIDNISTRNYSNNIDDISTRNNSNNIDDISTRNNSNNIDDISTRNNSNNIDDISTRNNSNNIDDISTRNNSNNSDDISTRNNRNNIDDISTSNDSNDASSNKDSWSVDRRGHYWPRSPDDVASGLPRRGQTCGLSTPSSSLHVPLSSFSFLQSGREGKDFAFLQDNSGCAFDLSVLGVCQGDRETICQSQPGAVSSPLFLDQVPHGSLHGSRVAVWTGKGRSSCRCLPYPVSSARHPHRYGHSDLPNTVRHSHSSSPHYHPSTSTQTGFPCSDIRRNDHMEEHLGTHAEENRGKHSDGEFRVLRPPSFVWF